MTLEPVRMHYNEEVKAMRWLEKVTYILRHSERPLSTREILDIITENEPERTKRKGFASNMSTLMSDMYKARHKTGLTRIERNGVMYHTLEKE